MNTNNKLVPFVIDKNKIIQEVIIENPIRIPKAKSYVRFGYIFKNLTELLLFLKLYFLEIVISPILGTLKSRVFC